MFSGSILLGCRVAIRVLGFMRFGRLLGHGFQGSRARGLGAKVFLGSGFGV